MVTVRTPLSGGELASVERLARRIESNQPSDRDPEQYFVEKSDIVDAFRRVIGALRVGHRIPNVDDAPQAARSPYRR